MLLAAFAGACSEKKPPPAETQIYSPSEIGIVLGSQDPSAAHLPALRRAAELLAVLQAQEDEGVHGKYHRIRPDSERELWTILSNLPVIAGGDHVLALALERVYTRYDRNYYHGAIWHYPYFNSRKAVALADKLLREYPASRLTEYVLWLKAFALRAPPLEPNDAASAFENYAEQTRWKPDVEAARGVFRSITSRFPSGRYAAVSRMLAQAPDIVSELPSGPLEDDPRSVGP